MSEDSLISDEQSNDEKLQQSSSTILTTSRIMSKLKSPTNGKLNNKK